jgi:hypothetical protein
LGVGQPLVYEYSREGIVPFEKGFLHLPAGESNGSNLLDEPLSGLYGSPMFGFDLPTHLETMTHSESVHLCAELKTGILVVPTDTGGLGTSTNS